MRHFLLHTFLSASLFSCTCGATEPATTPASPQGLVRFLGNTGLRAGKPWAFTPDGTGLFTVRDDSLYLWDSASGQPLRTFAASGRIFYTACSGDGKTVAGCTGNQITVWAVNTGEKTASVAVPEGWALSPVLSHDGKTIAWIMPNFKGITVRDVASSAEISRFSPDFKDGCSFRLQFSPDGSILAEAASGSGAPAAQGGAQGGVINFASPFSVTRIWDIRGKKLRFQSRENEAGIPAFAFSPDGKRLASGCHGLHLWDVASGNELDKIAPAGLATTYLAWTKDGRLLAVELDGPGACSAERLDTAGDRIHIQSTTPLPHPASTLSDDGRFVAYGEGGASIVETATGKPFGDNEAPVLSAKQTAFTGDGSQVVTVFEDGSIFAWEASSARLLRRFNLPVANIASAVLSADASTLITTDGTRISVYSMATGTELYTTAPIDKGQIALTAMTPDGKHIAGATRIFDNGMRWGLYVWNGVAPKFEHAINTADASNICWSANGGSIAVGCEEGDVHVYDGVSGAEKVTLRLNEHHAEARATGTNDFDHRIMAIDMSPDGLLVAATNSEGDLAIWETTTGKLVRLVPKIDAALPRVRFDPRGFALATEASDGTINFWEVATGVKIATLECGSGIQAWSFSPDGHYVVIGGNAGKNAIWKSPVNAAADAASLPPLDAKEFDKVWIDLADPDAGRAFHAARDLAGRGEPALRFLSEHLAFPPLPVATRTRALALIKDLSADEFKTRRAAERQLREISAQAHPVLVASSTHPESIDSRLALDRILSEGPATADLTPQDARYLRAISAVEQIRGPEAMKILQAVWETSTNAHATAEARASLARLRARSDAGTK